MNNKYELTFCEAMKALTEGKIVQSSRRTSKLINFFGYIKRVTKNGKGITFNFMIADITDMWRIVENE